MSPQRLLPVMVVVGTRPEAIKLAPVVVKLRASTTLRPIVVATGQHREMLDQVLELFGIRPEIDLDVGLDRQSLATLTARVVDRLANPLVATGPAAVLVQGDTTTSFAAALAAFCHRVPVVHLEAGLRTYDLDAPFPEEGNRRLTAQIARLHLAPTSASRDNLLAEAIDPDRVFVVGNTVIDALLWSRRRVRAFQAPALSGLDADDRRIVLVTAHRRESWGEPLKAIGRALASIARNEPDVVVVFPIHRNPIVRDAVLPLLDGLGNVRVTEPLDYTDFTRLMDRAHLILTDSGGVQEEGPSLGKPVLVLRDTTERPEGVTAGAAELVGTDPDRIVAAAHRLLHDPAAYARMATATNPYGDGHAARRVVGALDHLLNGAERPAEFSVEHQRRPHDRRTKPFSLVAPHVREPS